LDPLLLLIDTKFRFESLDLHIEMPFVKIVHSGDASKNGELAALISKVAASSLGKPEQYVCVDVTSNSNLLFGGSSEPAAMIQVQSIGGSCGKVCSNLTTAISQCLGIDQGRIFVNFQSFSASEWAMNGTTFG